MTRRLTEVNAKKEAASILDGFKAFLMRGNVIDLAVAVVIGAAFTSIVTAVVKGVINPLVGGIGTKNLDHYSVCVKGSCKPGADGVEILWGSVAGAALNFVITAAVVYFLMVMPMSKYLARQEARKQARTGKTEPEPIPVTELEVLQDIRDLLVAQRTGTVDGVVKQQRPAGPDLR
ncbi:large conductance mechanosensitive channel protein MscL [Streptomyces sp. NPDC002176]|uniref:large conductance mechanosensitive channel protein MscL n=1 Tax=Streptomyces sp. NPDC002176 TaxID=3364634 RepID=UPI00384EE290